MVLGAAFFLQTLALRRDASAKRAMKLFGFSITYLKVLFLAMGVTAVIRHP